MHTLPFRQVHLDFHTSPYILDVGEEFDPEVFAQQLEEAKVKSINIFARCHHGYCYYPTKVGQMHPGLKRDLLGEMIEALHRRGIKCPIYTTVVWDELSASTHPEWRQIDTNGCLIGRAPFEKYGWQFLCMNTEYMDYLEEHVREIIQLYEVDGLWFDIIIQHPEGCLCPTCKKSMDEKGMDISSKGDRLKHNLMVERKAMNRLSSLVRGLLPNALVVFNCRMRLDQRVEIGLRPEIEYMSHLEIESLPSGFWGYLHFPMYARFCVPLEKQVVGMTGRFHLAWGDFGGLKNQAALEYECNRALSLGAQCSVGDQLHPRGKLDKITYKRVGAVFSEIERKEPWCIGSKLKAEIGVLVNSLSEGSALGFAQFTGLESDEGATKMLMELHQQFHLVDEASDFNQYRVIIAPDNVIFSPILEDKISCFLNQGGSLLLTHESGLNPKKSNFVLPDFKVKYLGPSGYDVDYFRVGESISENLSTDYDYVLYKKGSKVEALEGSKVLSFLTHPYFNRDWKRFCSHRQTPPDKVSDDPFVIQQGKIIYISNPLFQAYREFGYAPYKTIVSNCLKLLLPDPMIQAENLPSAAELTVLEQNDHKRDIIHILFYVPERRGRIDIIEDIFPLRNVTLRYKSFMKPTRVYLAPQKEEVGFSFEEGCININVKTISGHQMIVIEY